MQRNKVTDAEAIEYILFKAAKPEGVSNAQVANYCECSDSRAYKLIKAAGQQFKLNQGRHWHEQGRCEVRYFIHTEHADAFAFAGISAIRKPNVPAPRQAIEHVEIPTMRRAEFSPRAGSMDFAQWPSRRGDRLHYRDGTVVPMQPTAQV